MDYRSADYQRLGQGAVKAFGVMGLIVVTIVVALVGFEIIRGRLDALHDAQALSSNLSQTVAEELSDDIRLADVGLLAISDEIAREQAGGGVDPRQTLAFIDRQDSRNPYTLGYQVYDADGRLRFAVHNVVNSSGGVSDFDDFKYLRDHADAGLVFAEPREGPVTRQWILAASRRFNNPDGSFGGVVVCPAPLALLVEKFKSIDVGAGGAVSMTNQAFHFVARYPDIQGNPRLMAPNVVTPRFQAIIRAGANAPVPNFRSRIDGVERIGFMRKVPDYPFYLLVSVAKDEYLTNWREHSLHLGIFAAMLVGLTGFWVLTNRKRILERERAERALAESEAKLRGLFELSPVGIARNALDGRFIEFNDSFRAITGYDADELLKLDYWALTPKGYEADEQRQLDLLREVGRYGPYEKEYRRKDGDLVPLRLHGMLMTDRLGESYIWSLFEDVSAAKQAEAALHLYANAVRHSGQAILITDENNKIVEINQAFTQLTGYTLDELVGCDPHTLGSAHTPTDTYRLLWASLTEGGFWQGELLNRAKDGSFFPVLAVISAIRDASGKVINFIASYTDISDRKAAEQRIQQLAHHDPLTDLYNRFSLESRLEQAVLTARREDERLAVLFIDLDRFKMVNDTMGHHAGDKLLLEVAKRLTAAVRESDVVARLGGDEFVVVVTGIAAGMMAATIAEKILHGLNQPYLISGADVHSSTSIGISIFPEDGEDSEALMKAADMALYHAKEQGRNNFQFFTPAMNQALAEVLSFEKDLRAGLAERQFELYYQPKVHTSDHRVAGVEALIRWHHPVRGLVPPDKFIPLAEDCGLIEAIGDWVLEEACRQWADWSARGLPLLTIAVNLSAHQLAAPSLVERVHEVIARYGVPAGVLELEVTETVAMHNPERAIIQLKALGALGVSIAIDDFGTGYSSLAYLKLLPIQTLKLDRTFVRDIETDESDAAIGAATLALAHTLGLKVVAEGVETEAQRDFLAAHACDYLQGYLFAKPLPAGELEAFLTAR